MSALSAHAPVSSGVAYSITSSSKFILSTSGRVKSCQRYKTFLQDILGLDIVYVPTHTLADEMTDASQKIDPQEFVWALRGLPCIGGAISRDIKQSVIAFLDELDESASAVNSVNTVVRRGKILRGFNTDVMGFRSAIEKGLVANPGIVVKNSVIYGYGGVTNVAAYVLKSMGIAVYITGRRIDMVMAKAAELDVGIWTPEVQADLFVNAAPVSSSPLEGVPTFLDALAGCKLVFDHELSGCCLVDHCAAAGIIMLSGMTMYVPQMTAQWGLFLAEIVDAENASRLLADLVATEQAAGTQ